MESVAAMGERLRWREIAAQASESPGEVAKRLQ
jgi:hypothetical protein